MEDRNIKIDHMFLPCLNKEIENPVDKQNDQDFAYFAVYDGHSGSRCVDYVLEHLHEKIFNSKYAKKGEIPLSILRAFLKVDQEFGIISEKEKLRDGTTVVCCVIHGDNLIVAHAGDSRAIMCRGKVAIVLTDDHKPDRKDEMKRIIDLGGTVPRDQNTGYIYRVNGQLAISRSLGDNQLKKPVYYVSSEPEISIISLKPGDQFIVLASDGLWDVFKNQKVVDIVRKCSDKNKAASYLVNEAIKFGSSDNITVVIVWLTWSYG